MKKSKMLPMLLSLVLSMSTALAGGWKSTGAAVEIVRSEQEIFMNPRWSPDGQFLAFTKANYRGIFIWEASSGEIRQLNDEIGAGYGMLWHQSANLLLTRTAQYRGYRRYAAVKVFDLSSDTGKTLVPYRKSLPDLPRWTARGNVYFADRRAVHEIVFGKGKGSQIAAIPADGLFAIQRRALAMQSSEKGGLARVDRFAGKRIINLSWSPDFVNILFEVVGGNMFILSADGENVTDLGPGDRPCWAPDGRAVAFMVSADDGHHFTASDLFIINADGSGRSQITHTVNLLEMNPAWAPDGNSLVFDVLGQGAIYTIPVAVTDKR